MSQVKFTQNNRQLPYTCPLLLWSVESICSFLEWERKQDCLPGEKKKTSSYQHRLIAPTIISYGCITVCTEKFCLANTCILKLSRMDRSSSFLFETSWPLEKFNMISSQHRVFLWQGVTDESLALTWFSLQLICSQPLACYSQINNNGLTIHLRFVSVLPLVAQGDRYIGWAKRDREMLDTHHQFSSDIHMKKKFYFKWLYNL